MKISKDRTLDTVTPNEWRLASPEERHEFLWREQRKGFVCMTCTNCGYPTPVGQSRCDACWHD